jgi:CHAD domain-containing protein
MSEAGRKALLLHFSRMLANEAGTRAGEDIEALHDMRVATRRMRAAYGIFAEHFKEAAVKPFNKALRRTGRALGTVRDLDVLIEKAETFQASFPPEQPVNLEPLLDDWHTRREVARRHMLDYLDSSSYHEFVQAFGDFLMTPGAGAREIPSGEPIPYQVRHIVPRLIFTRYEVVRAYEPIIETAPLTTYHLLRIDCKRLRYVLEFFRDVLGSEAPKLIKQVTEMQDLLGALQDSHVAEGLIEEFLRGQTKRKKKASTLLDGVEAYLAAQHGMQEDLLVQFPRPWAALVGPDFRRNLALAVAEL